jgi:hypothetical protein
MYVASWLQEEGARGEGDFEPKSGLQFTGPVKFSDRFEILCISLSSTTFT